MTDKSFQANSHYAYYLVSKEPFEKVLKNQVIERITKPIEWINNNITGTFIFDFKLVKQKAEGLSYVLFMFSKKDDRDLFEKLWCSGEVSNDWPKKGISVNDVEKKKVNSVRKFKQEFDIFMTPKAINLKWTFKNMSDEMNIIKPGISLHNPAKNHIFYRYLLPGMDNERSFKPGQSQNWKEHISKSLTLDLHFLFKKFSTVGIEDTFGKRFWIPNTHLTNVKSKISSIVEQQSWEGVVSKRLFDAIKEIEENVNDIKEEVNVEIYHKDVNSKYSYVITKR